MRKRRRRKERGGGGGEQEEEEEENGTRDVRINYPLRLVSVNFIYL
jgi:hypothetical protein